MKILHGSQAFLSMGVSYVSATSAPKAFGNKTGNGSTRASVKSAADFVHVEALVGEILDASTEGGVPPRKAELLAYCSLRPWLQL